MFTWGVGLGTNFDVVFLVFFEGGWNKVKGFSLCRLDAWMILKLTCDLIWEAGGNGEYDGGKYPIVWINTPHQKSSIMRTWQTWFGDIYTFVLTKKCSVVSCKFQGVHLPEYLDEAGHGQSPITGLLLSFCWHGWPSLDVWRLFLRSCFAAHVCSARRREWQFTISYSKCSGLLVDVSLLWCWTVKWMERNALPYLVAYP